MPNASNLPGPLIYNLQTPLVRRLDGSIDPSQDVINLKLIEGGDLLLLNPVGFFKLLGD